MKTLPDALRLLVVAKLAARNRADTHARFWTLADYLFRTPSSWATGEQTEVFEAQRQLARDIAQRELLISWLLAQVPHLGEA